MASFLVTGGCGFIGSHLVDRLLSKGHEVRILDNLSRGSEAYVPADAALVVGDVTDGDTVTAAMHGIDGCFHLAAVSASCRTRADWPGSHQVNLSGSVNVFDAARERRVPVVYASSSAVYGDNADMPLREHASLRPQTAYGADKLGNELHARVASLVYGVPTVGLRLFNVYGPRRNPADPCAGVVPRLMDNVLHDRPIKVHGDGEQIRDFVYVTDVVSFFEHAMAKAASQPTVFNVCSGRATSIKQLAHLLRSITGRQVSVEYAAARPGDIRASVGDPARSRDVLGVRTEIVIADGLRQLLGQQRRVDVDRAMRGTDLPRRRLALLGTRAMPVMPVGVNE